jgi:hypothetical protein
VVAAFVISSGLTLLTSIIALFMDLIADDMSQNKMDRYFCQRFAFDYSTESEILSQKFWTNVIERLVLGFSDQQLVTGLAIMLTAFIRLGTNTNGITTYHFSLVTDLAWFSCNTHLITLFVLRDYFIHFSVLRNVRMMAMALLAGLLIASAVMSSHQLWYIGTERMVDGKLVDYTSFNCPALCLVDNLGSNIGGSPLRWGIANVVLLVWAYLMAMIPVLVIPSRHLLDSSESQKNSYTKVKKGVSAIYDFLKSKPFNVAFNLAWFALGLVSMFYDRSRGQALLAANETEDSWGFGQIVALLLVLLPFLAAAEIYYGTDFLMSWCGIDRYRTEVGCQKV